MNHVKKNPAPAKKIVVSRYWLLTATAVLMGLVWSVTNVGYDGCYQVAMGYRMVKGDAMFLEMWEPHQTSAFLCALLMALYLSVFHTSTGIVLFLQLTGMVIRGGISLLFYRVLKDRIAKPVAYLTGLLFFLISPKDYALPEFSNMQLWFGALLVIFLILYVQTGRVRYLAGGAVSMCLLVLSYPGCLMVFPIGCLLLWRYSPEKPWKAIAVFAGICAVLGAAYGGFFLWKTGGLEGLLDCACGILSLEPTHTVKAGGKILAYGRDALRLSLCLLAVFGAGWLLTQGLGLLFPLKDRKNVWILLCFSVLQVGFLINIFSVRDRYAYGVILVALVGFGWIVAGKERMQSEKEQGIYRIGSLVSLGCVLATLTATDLPLITAVPYGVVAGAFALIPLKGWYDRLGNDALKRWAVGVGLCFVGLLIFRGIYIRTPLVGRGQITSIMQDMSVVRSGPAFGIVTDEKSAAMERDSVADFRTYIAPGSRIWIVDGVVNSLGYLYLDTEVAAPSVMSTPYYSGELLKYWEKNPEKQPDVIVAAAYGGELSYDLRSNEWFMEWLEKEYCPTRYVDGVFWRFYYK